MKYFVQYYVLGIRIEILLFSSHTRSLYSIRNT